MSDLETQKEADHWKSIGNRHMANKEYQDAYTAYCSAIKLSPLGPSSHIFLSNRAAALLSLKRYSAASVDARRAITLAPTFGKAHARLGQSLYFLKDYAGAVAAYENAFQFEPDNNVTWTYLNKAKKKFERENERRRKREDREFDEKHERYKEKDKGKDKLKGKGGDKQQQYQQQHQHQQQQQQDVKNRNENTETETDVDYESRYNAEQYTYHDNEDSDTVDLANMAISVAESAPRSPARSTSSRDSNGNGNGNSKSSRSNPNILHSTPTHNMHGIHASLEKDRMRLNRLDEHDENINTDTNTNTNTNIGTSNTNTIGEEEFDYDDPDFDEALRLQEAAAMNLVQKKYRQAVEEFSAALFLVPDDDNLTPQLYVGRAHSLNGLERHEGALNDAMMALGRDPEMGEAHLVLARTYFYLRDYNEAEQSFENAIECLGSLTPLDQVYWKKARDLGEVASLDLDNDDRSRSTGFSISRHSQAQSKPVPKLKPPRFVSRQQQLNSTQNVPPMPKKWAQQMKLSEQGGLPDTLKVGPERIVTFLSKPMGVKLNRGPDGIVRVLSASSTIDRPDISRQGDIFTGDILREAAGVDLRRPLTSVMWSDTVALLKIAPRPMVVKVAMELSKKLPAVQKEFDAARIVEEEKNNQMMRSSTRQKHPHQRTPQNRGFPTHPMMSPPSC